MVYWDTFSDADSDSSSDDSSTASLDDEDEINARCSPNWEFYRSTLLHHGFQLDTVKDVKQFYERYWSSGGKKHLSSGAEYARACAFQDENALCKDPGLNDNLFRGHRISDGTRIVVKAVHIKSRELDITRLLSTPPLRDDPMNHCIPVLDLVEIREHRIAFIVMEEWSSQLIPDTPCCLRLFLGTMRSCIEHVVFMHKHAVCHLDISLRNLVTDYKGHYASIDFELSRRYEGERYPRIRCARGTELPPEVERGEWSDPFKVDIWALGVLILRACDLTGYLVQELILLTAPMLYDDYTQRPTASAVLKKFDSMTATMDAARLEEAAPSH